MVMSAILLFSIQPMVAKTLLPIFGGTPAVWTVCMLFFQTILLLAYGYVWLLSSFKKNLRWRSIHTIILLLSVTALPVLFHPVSSEALPEWTILSNLILQVGLPLLVIGSTAPLLQFAYSQTQGKYAADPYFLYIASNCGSLTALLLYPWFIERLIGLQYQFYLWNIAYGLYVGCTLIILYGTRFNAFIIEPSRPDVVSWRTVCNWIFFSFIPCSLMLGVTLYSTTDMAATPLFWVLPLALYLISFILAFRSKPLIANKVLVGGAVFFILTSLLGCIFGVGQIPAWEIIAFNLLGFFVQALLCHRQLYAQRPATQSLTLFYFCLSIGGVLAGVFNGLIAPHCFNQVYEYPLALLLSIVAIPMPKKIKTWSLPLLISGGSLLFVGVIYWQSADVLVQTRSFYAVNKVENKNGIHVFFSQSTVHGLQDMSEQKPLSGFRSYYGAVQPVVESLKVQFPSMSITLMGLGMGTMLCQFRETDTVRAIEIDQQVIDIAKNNTLFTYLRDCPPAVEIIKDDGRLAVSRLVNGSQQLIILDAFNSDAVPMHLLTNEAFSLYKTKLSKKGLILVNLSNRHLQFLPVINALGHSLDLLTLHLVHKGDAKLGQLDSEWALLTANEALAFSIMQASNWQFVAGGKEIVWTDDYSNIIPLFRS